MTIAQFLKDGNVIRYTRCSVVGGTYRGSHLSVPQKTRPRTGPAEKVCLIELRMEDTPSFSYSSSALSVASVSISCKVDRCWNCHETGYRYTQCSWPRRGTFCVRYSKSAANTCAQDLCERILQEKGGVCVECHPLANFLIRTDLLPVLDRSQDRSHPFRGRNA